ncbi:hypothetical protein BDW22DRAFT_1360250 [Trametopsis cervina]|nr:hypothetical protein BDW22DRAFT_1360250 [Trametopsis cervina]
MDKLRKRLPVSGSPKPSSNKSQTMMIAQAAAPPGGLPVVSSGSRSTSVARIDHATTVSRHNVSSIKATAMTQSEQYWAARALTAEALLSAKVMHQQELTTLSTVADVKRTEEVTALRHAHEIRESRLEKLIVALGALLLCLIGVIIYGVFAGLGSSKHSRKSSAMHFTIPILSPFASVVEHETSVIGSKMLIIFAMILAACLYGCFRYWLSHQR